MLNLHELNVFVESALAENFSVAAGRLYLSQPAVSLHIRNLEQQLGIELFHRRGRKIVLSDAGKMLLPMAQDALGQARHIEETIRSLKGTIIGELSIACSTTVGKYILPILVASFRRQYPVVQVSINVIGPRAATEWVLNSRADIGVLSTHLPHNDLVFERFLDDRVVLIAPADHPWADGRSVATKDLMSVPLILRESTAGTYRLLSDALSTHGLSIEDLQVVLTLSNAEAIEMSVEAGIGLAFVSRLAATRGLALRRVVEVPVSDINLTRTIYMVRHERYADTPLVQAFWRHVFDPSNDAVRQMTAIQGIDRFPIVFEHHPAREK